MRVDCYRFVRWQLAWPAVLVNAMAQFFFFFFWPHPWHGGGAQLSKPRPQKKYAALAMKFAC